MDNREKFIDIICPFATCCHTRNEYGCFTPREHWYPCASVKRTDQIIALFDGVEAIRDAFNKGYEKGRKQERERILALLKVDTNNGELPTSLGFWQAISGEKVLEEG